jgi:hypothetical protein
VTDQKSEQDTDKAPQMFSTFLLQHAKGRTHEELSKALQEVVLAARETGKAGSITLKLNIKSLTDAEAFEVTDTVSVKVPTGARPKSLWFATDEGELTRDNPHQLALMHTEETNRR